MKIGLISDIHANATALNAVLQDMEEVDTLVCCGDIVGYGPSPQKSVELIRDTADLCVQGNHDRAVANASPYSELKEGQQLASDVLTADQSRWLSSLPEKASNSNIKITHSHPGHTDKYVYKRHFPMMGKYAEEQELFALGHTHLQDKLDLSQFEGHNVVVVNPGSVGQPRDGDPRARYAVAFIDAAGHTDVSLKAVEYDTSTVAEKIRDVGLPEINAYRVENGELPPEYQSRGI